MSVTPHDKTKFMVIAPGVSPPQYGEFAAFAFSLCFFIIFFGTFTGRTGQQILTRHASNDAKDVRFGGQDDSQFLKGVQFPP
jgi:hypothetical protein